MLGGIDAPGPHSSLKCVEHPLTPSVEHVVERLLWYRYFFEIKADTYVTEEKAE